MSLRTEIRASSCATYLWHLAVNSVVLLDYWIIGKIRSSRGVCRGGMSVPEFASSYALLDRKERMLWLQRDYSLSVAGSNCSFEITFPVLNMLTCRKEEIAHMSTQIILQDAGTAPVLTFVIFSSLIASHALLVWLPESSSRALGKSTGYMANLCNGRVYAKYSS